MSYKAVQERLRLIGIVMIKKGATHRVNFFGGLEDTAYYTDSLDDALAKGIAMAARPSGLRPPLPPGALRRRSIERG
jgi:hypothetical protein